MTAIPIVSPINIMSIAFAPSETQLAAVGWKTGALSSPVYLCDISKGSVAKTFDLKGPAITRSLFFTNEKSISVLGSVADSGVDPSAKQPTRIWDAASGATMATIDSRWNVYFSPSAISRDHTTLAMGKTKNLTGPTSYGFAVWSLATGKFAIP